MPASSVAETIAIPGVVAGRKGAWLLPCLGALVCGVFLWAVGHGAVPLSPGQILAILFRQINVDLPWMFTPREEAVVLWVRLPRVVFGLLVGSGLSASGVLLQALFRNPLADPGLIGISSGAATGAALVIVLGNAMLSPWTQYAGRAALPLAAFLVALGAMALIRRLASYRGQTVITTMLLAGIAVNAAASSVLGLLAFIADDTQLRNISFWMLGSLSGGTWKPVGIVAVLVGFTLLVIPFLARSLNALLLGEAEAAHLGIPVERIKKTIVLLTAAVVAASTAFCGIIGFVGLVVPHLVRLIAGPDHRIVLPGSVLLGATLLMSADLAARTAITPAELPIGVLTSMVGSPFFFWLLLRERSRRMLG